MRLSEVLNLDRVRAMNVDPNAYIMKAEDRSKDNLNKADKVKAQEVEKVIFPEPYENVGGYYSRDQFRKPTPPPPPEPAPCPNNNHPNKPMFDLQSLLPMLMSGKFNDILKPLMSMLGGSSGGGIGDITKIFELFKPKAKGKTKKEGKKEEDISSKFDDMIIIED